MSEGEILEQFQQARANIGFLISLILTAHSAMIVATHFFLGRERLALKLMVFIIYTGGYVGILSLYQWELNQVTGLEAALTALQGSEGISAAGENVLAWHGGPGGLQAWLPWFLYFFSWLMVAVYLFFFRVFDREAR